MRKIWNDWATVHGLPAEEVIAYAHGRSTRPVLERFAPHLDAAAEAAALLRAEADELETVRPLPGALALIGELSGAPWAVVTSCPHEMAVRRLALLGVANPPILIGGDRVKCSKPHPEGYVLAATNLGVRPVDCVVFEDSPAGVEAGKAAGAKVVAVATTHPLSKLASAAFWVANLGDVQARLVPGRAKGNTLVEISRRDREPRDGQALAIKH